jgi:hypothetical protein
VASLDVQDYLQRDVDALLESALLSLWSDVNRNPSSPGYDMTIPPANQSHAAFRCGGVEESGGEGVRNSEEHGCVGG